MDAGGQLVFVYGTLKVGQPNFDRLRPHIAEGDIGVVGNAVTRRRYPLVLATEYNVPCLLDASSDRAKPIRGQVFRVTDAGLSLLDAIESAPHFYTRHSVDVVCEDGSSLSCWCYFLNRPHPDLLLQTYHEEYDSAVSGWKLADLGTMPPAEEEALKLRIAEQMQLAA